MKDEGRIKRYKRDQRNKQDEKKNPSGAWMFVSFECCCVVR
jgi:GH15 family glucan-1,4-alpha-glucosidase